MLKKQAAEALGISPARVSQLIKAGQLRPEPDGSVTVAEVERCRRESAIHWQSAGLRSGRRSAAQLERERKDLLWYNIGVKLRGRGYNSWTYAQIREAWQDFRAAILEVDPSGALLND
jgi:hypothetical protein